MLNISNPTRFSEHTGSESEAPRVEETQQLPQVADTTLTPASVIEAPREQALFTAPSFVMTLNDLEVEEGRPVHFECQLIGHPMPEVTWLLDQVEIRDTKVYVMQSTAEGVCTLDIAEAFPEDEGEFTCRAENEYGTTETTAELIVKGKLG